MRKPTALLAAVLVAASALVGVTVGTPAGSAAPASAATASTTTTSSAAFDPGDIISDANFYDGAGMTSAQIQAFLTQQVGTCTSSTCLAKGTTTLVAHPADAMCSAVAGGTGLSVAATIARVSTACGIAPQVILTTLQKEQSLVTAKAPSASALAAAMGYACPDTGNGCDSGYSGLGNQVYWSAWQWKRYGNPTGTSEYFTWFAPGAAHTIQYNPTVSCGSKTVTVQNAATAALYYYTPYTPNAAALANLYGTGDACSAYGNRNFWRIYRDWFGSPTGTTSTATGHLDSVTTTYGALTVGGWAADTGTSASTKVVVQVDGVGTTVAATASRPDVAKAYPSLGAAHGFTTTLAAAAGAHAVCVVADSATGSTSTSLGCQTVTVASASPFGHLDVLAAVPGGVSVGGWAIDPETTASIGVRITVDGTALPTVTASAARADVGRAYPASGSAHGFGLIVPASAGTHTFCVTALNTGRGADSPLGGCATFRVPGSAPIGSFDAATTTSTSVTVGGWALDGDTTAPIQVHVYVDGVIHGVTASTTRTDIARTFPSYGSAHGYSATYRLPAGTHEVCVSGMNTGAGATNTSFGCRTVTITDRAPIGSVDAVTPSVGTVTVGGWAIDPDTTASIGVHVYVDGAIHAVTASVQRADVARAYPQYGGAHGYTASYPVAAGKHTVCVYAMDSDGGANTALACRTVTVPTR